jgi:hypothetical protein
MNRFYKTLLLWLLVAMLPLHAVSAAMPMSCDPVHHKAMQVALQDDAHHQHHDMGTAAHGHHPHEAAHMTDAAADDAMTDSASSGAHPHAGCSACAASCIGAAAPPFALNSTPAFAGSEAVLLAPPPLVVGYTPTDLERPPRHILV